MRVRTRKAWRHFKYKLLELFFGKPELKRLIDIDQLDFNDAVKLTRVQVEKRLTQEEHDFFFDVSAEKLNVRYSLQYALARDMVELIAKHIQIAKIYDTDEEKYVCVGMITLCERK